MFCACACACACGLQDRLPLLVLALLRGLILLHLRVGHVHAAILLVLRLAVLLVLHQLGRQLRQRDVMIDASLLTLQIELLQIDLRLRLQLLDA